MKDEQFKKKCFDIKQRDDREKTLLNVCVWSITKVSLCHMANILGLLIKSMTVKNHSRSLRHFKEKPQVKIGMTPSNLPIFPS